ncbi:MAG: FKBP-type peptidyl-prolyl cis-trans isomerase [Thiopseudomonas sp.]|nr:FKBP-type peptidyl-prolyl cis-trans isomerase [Thiopseudomonas sp.]
MKLKHLAAVVAVATLTLTGCDNKAAADKVELKTPEQKVSYGIGLGLGKNIKDDGIDGISPQAVAAGMADALAGKQRLDDEELQKAFTFVQERELERANALNDETAKAGKAFLAENAKREGVITTESGLQYKVLVKADGKQPKASDTVRVHYEGTLTDGSVFDSSVERGEPVEFPVMAVIPGWVEALQLMHVGEKYQLFVPSDLAYGPTSPTPAIPANSTLVFEVELLAIVGDESASLSAIDTLEDAAEAAGTAAGEIAGKTVKAATDAATEAAALAEKAKEAAAAALEEALSEESDN